MIHKYTKNFQILTIFLSVIIFSVLFSASSSFTAFNKNIQTQYHTLKNTLTSANINPQIIIVWIDEESFDDIWQFPFDRRVYAESIENLNTLGVASIWVDILLLDRSTEADDNILRNTLADLDNIVLWASIDRDGRVFLPQTEIFWWITDYWYVSPLVDSSNRTTYSFRPLRNSEWHWDIEHFSLRILRNFYSRVFERDYLSFWEYRNEGYYFSPQGYIPLSRTDTEEVLIRFTPSYDFQYISFSDTLDNDKLEEFSRSVDFKDSIVVIGPAAEWLKDEFFTPVWLEYWVFVHANILNTILTRQYLQYFDSTAEWILIFCIVLISVIINFSKRSIVLLYGNLAIIWVFVVFIPLASLLFTNLILNFPFEIISSFIFSFWLTNLVKYLIEDTNKARLWKALSEYVSFDIMEEVLNEEWKIYLNGQKKELVVCFSDIENFTHLSEVLCPEELVDFLREYLGVCTEILMKHGAYIDKYEWDSIMALWWAFHPINSESMNQICEALFEQKREIQQLSKKWNKKFWQDLKVRNWIHIWEAIIGNIWAPGRKMNFTALWDTVNLASRLEWVNKYYESYICISEDFVKKVSPEYIFCELDTIKVLGKDIWVKIYTLLWKQWKISRKLLVHKEQYEYALELYRKWDFKRASELFQELFQEKFFPAKTMYTRTQKFLINPPDIYWDGIWIMEGK